MDFETSPTGVQLGHNSVKLTLARKLYHYPFFATLGGGVVLVVLHRIFAHLAYYSHGFGILVKGKPDTIVRDGECDFPVMRRNHVSTHDLEEDMRLSAHTDDLSKIRLARVERSGDISFIKKII